VGFNFPDNPAEGDKFTPVVGLDYIWKNARWYGLQYKTKALKTCALDTAERLGWLKVNVESNDTMTSDVEVELTAPGGSVALFSQRFPVVKDTPTTVALGDTAAIDVVASAADLNLGWSKAGNTYNHIVVGNKLAVSTDGINWKSYPTPAGGPSFYGVAIGGPPGDRVFVRGGGGVGQPAVIGWSSDGINWTDIPVGSAGYQWYTPSWSAFSNRWVVASNHVAANEGRLATSDDNGRTWVQRSDAVVNGRVYMNFASNLDTGRIVGVSTTTSSTRSCYSNDGLAWFNNGTIAQLRWQDIVWGGPSAARKFVAVASDGTGNRIQYSSNGVDWVAAATIPDTQWYGVGWSEELQLFVACATTGTNRGMTSPDGITWTQITIGDLSNWVSVAYDMGLDMWACVANTSSAGVARCRTSPTGQSGSWVERVIADQNAWECVAGSNGRFVAVASTDGVYNEKAIWPLTAAVSEHWRGKVQASGVSGTVSAAIGSTTVATRTTPGTTLFDQTIASAAGTFELQQNTGETCALPAVVCFKALPGSLPQGLYDVHVYPYNGGAGRGTPVVFPNVQVL
jgi:hypothetical protein